MNLLKSVAERIAKHVERWRPRQTMTIFLGDYIDRGPASRDVVEFLIRGFPTPVIALRGNHESLLLQFLDRPDVLSVWGRLGGLETLQSYGVVTGRTNTVDPYRIRQAFLHRLPSDHLAFFKTAPLYLEVGHYFFCHAGVRPGVSLREQVETDLLTIRTSFLAHKESFGKIVVHGHTITSRPELLPNRINIDTGAYATGCLTCLLLRRDGMRFI